MISKLKYYWKLYQKLIKFRLSLMVTISAFFGYLLASKGVSIDFLWVFLGVLLMAGGSSGINQYQERHLDAKMTRTQYRPIPSGSIKASNALIISSITALSGFFVLLLTGLIPAILGLLNLIFYNLAYTPLKTKSPLSILPGAVVGAIPPMIGWTAAGGYLFHPNIVYIAIFMFSWQLPHFWLLLIMYGQEYEKAGFSSISKYFNQNQIKYLVFAWTLITSVFIFLFPLFDIILPSGLTIALILINLSFIFIFYKLIFGNSDKQRVRTAFAAINSYMLLVLIIFILNLVF